jgi:glycerol-3-phosphate cytidylyltransferase
MRLYTGGTFDLFHAGHVSFLRSCKSLTGYNGEVVVALNTDEFIQEYKGKPPIYPYDQRFELLSSCRYVDRVVPNEGGADSKISISKVKPDLLVVGSDWATKDYYAQMQFTQEWLDANKIILAFIPYTENVSTTLIRTKL